MPFLIACLFGCKVISKSSGTSQRADLFGYVNGAEPCDPSSCMYVYISDPMEVWFGSKI